MTSDEKERRINSLVSQINGLLMGDFNFEEDRISAIESFISDFHQMPAIEYYALKDDQKEKSKVHRSTQESVRINIQSFKRFILNKSKTNL